MKLIDRLRKFTGLDKVTSKCTFEDIPIRTVSNLHIERQLSYKCMSIEDFNELAQDYSFIIYDLDTQLYYLISSDAYIYIERGIQ